MPRLKRTAANKGKQAVEPSRPPEKHVSEKETQTEEPEVSERRQGTWSRTGRSPATAEVGESQVTQARRTDPGEGARDMRGLPDASAMGSKSPIPFADKAGGASNALEDSVVDSERVKQFLKEPQTGQVVEYTPG